MLWFVSLVFTDFHKYFIVHGVLFCFVFCLVVRDCIVDASFDHNYLLLFVFFFNERQQKRELSKFISVSKMFVLRVHCHQIAKDLKTFRQNR